MSASRAQIQKISRNLLPLLQVLKHIKPEDRIILLSHFSDEAKDDLYKTISHVLLTDSVPKRRRRTLHAKLAPYKKIIKNLMSSRTSPRGKRKRVVQLGGNALGYVLSTAVPMFVNLFAS